MRIGCGSTSIGLDFTASPTTTRRLSEKVIKSMISAEISVPMKYLKKVTKSVANQKKSKSIF